MHGQSDKAIITDTHCNIVEIWMNDITDIYFDKDFDYFSVKYIH